MVGRIRGMRLGGLTTGQQLRVVLMHWASEIGQERQNMLLSRNRLQVHNNHNSASYRREPTPERDWPGLGHLIDGFQAIGINSV